MITKAKYLIGALCFLSGIWSCSDMLETDSTRQLFDPSLNQKTDSVFYALGVLQGMQQLADQYVFQGEMRGELTAVTDYTDNNLRQLAAFDQTSDNKYDSAYVYYRVINNCNYYIAHRDTTLISGADSVTMKEYAAIKAIRAWAYLQLARTYRKVPFYKEPLTQISQIDDNNYPELSLEEIVSELAPDLEQYSGKQYAPPSYAGTYPLNSILFPRQLFIPVDVILGEMYLETGQYQQAARHYVTYLTEVATSHHTAYTTPYQSRNFMFGGNEVLLPSDWQDNRNSFDVTGNNPKPKSISGTETWRDLFTTDQSVMSDDVITYIPMARSKQEGVTTLIPKAFGYDFYANVIGYIDEIQIQPSQVYLDLVNSQDYYYYSMLSQAYPVINSTKIGDTRYSAFTYDYTDTETDSTTVWITKYNSARVILYRVSTVWLHLAEAFNRLGMYDAAFAILKDGIHSGLLNATYISDETKQALQTTYPLLSTANLTSFRDTEVKNLIGVHCHGTGYACDAAGSTVSTTISYQSGVSPYRLHPVVTAKMQEIANKFGVSVGTTKQDTINAMEDLLCDEYALELAFEGSRFDDLCRLARHKNGQGAGGSYNGSPTSYGANFGGQWLAKKLASKNVAGLENEDKWYRPFK